MEATKRDPAFGPYLLERRIATRRRIELYRATAIGTDGRPKPVALRRTGSLDDGVHDRFLAGAMNYAVVHHSSIAEVVDLGTIDGRSYIVTDFVDGRDLLKVLARCAQVRLGFPTDVALHVLDRVLAALQAAHDTKDREGRSVPIVHGDLCHSNVLLTDEGDVAVTDFSMGIASTRRRTTSGLHQGAKNRFTCYASPEQLRGETATERSDVFMAGILLYELVTGRVLFKGRDDEDLVELIASERFEVPLERHRADLHPRLARIVHTALAADPAHRFASARAFSEAIAGLLDSVQASVDRRFLAQLMRRLFDAGAAASA
ncbi:MAG: serine/threonine-protein kinase [Deltaproteobacteria bacterium]